MAFHRLLAVLPALRHGLCLVILLLLAAAFALAQEDEAAFLQVTMEAHGEGQSVGQRDLAMAYVPYNFGHTVAVLAAKQGIQWGDCGSRLAIGSPCLGHQRSAITGCELMYTPAKHWPADLARKHFGNKTVFGILRDPYERMVAQFRGSGKFTAMDLFAKCDVSGFVKRALGQYQADSPYSNNCQQLPQAEFFDQPFGATVFVDNRRFPESANELLLQHGYTDLKIRHEDVVHVSGCDHVWAADLDEEAKALIRKVYSRDFELICKHFGYCAEGENTCLTHIQGMCPEQLFKWDATTMMYQKK